MKMSNGLRSWKGLVDLEELEKLQMIETQIR